MDEEEVVSGWCFVKAIFWGAMPTLVLRRGHGIAEQAWPQQSTAVAMAPSFFDLTMH